MEIIWLIFVVLFGLCVGSFLNVVVYRMPRGISIVFPGSHCPNCGKAIRWYDNVPLLGWLILRGRCRFCKKPISARYPLIEGLTALLAGGLYAWFFMLNMRDETGAFADAWPMYLAHAILLCGLLACSIVDIEMWIVPLEICWFVSLAGIVGATAAPHPFVPAVSPTCGAMSIAAVVGLVVSIMLMKFGLIQPSFIDVDENCDDSPQDSKKTSVAISKDHGVNPRVEILREVLFLAPVIAATVGAYFLVTKVGYVKDFWNNLNSETASGRFAVHFAGFQAALFGYLIGGLWIWGVRILGTLGFGKEAMGMGDVHILAAVGAVTGWIVPSVTFFVAPFFGLAWGLYLWMGRKQRELPYGPWLAVASLAVILFHDAITVWLTPHARAIAAIWER